MFNQEQPSSNEGDIPRICSNLQHVVFHCRNLSLWSDLRRLTWVSGDWPNPPSTTWLSVSTTPSKAPNVPNGAARTAGPAVSRFDRKTSAEDTKP